MSPLSGPTAVRPPGVSEYRCIGLWACPPASPGMFPHPATPVPGLHLRRTLQPGTLLATCPLQTGSPNPPARAPGHPLPRGRTKASAEAAARNTRPLAPLLRPGAPGPVRAPLPGPLAGLQLCVERSRLGSSSSTAPLPHYPDVGPSPPRLYRLSAGSARVMRALLITIAQTPLTLTAPSEERQHLLCAGRRPSPAPCSPSLAAPLFPGPLPLTLFSTLSGLLAHTLLF